MLLMKKRIDPSAEKNVEGAHRSFAEKNACEEFPKIEPERAAYVADDVRGRKREEAPADYDPQFVLPEFRSEFRDLRGVFLFEVGIQPQVVREKVYGRRRDHDTGHRQDIERDRRDEEEARGDEGDYRYERYPSQHSE